MDHLSSTDASFLHLETPETPMHVGSLMLLELPEGYQGDYFDDVKAQRDGWQKQAEASQRLLADTRPRRGLFGWLKAS